MKKLIVAVIVVLVVAGTVGPYCAGIASEKAFRRLVNRLGREMDVTIETTYQRGWFNSTAVTTMDLGSALKKRLPPEAAQSASSLDDLLIRSVHYISHGPLPIATTPSGSGIPLPALARIKDVHTISLPAAVGTSLVVTTHTTINFDTSADTAVATDPFHKLMDDGTTVDVQRLTGTVTVPAGSRGISCSFAWPGMTIQSDQENASVANMTFQCIQKRGALGLRTGSINFGFASCVIAARDDSSMLIEGFSLQGASAESGDMINGNATISFAKAVLQTNLFGPGTATIVMDNLHAPTLAALRDVLEDMQKNKESAMAKFASLAKVGALMTDLLARAPRIELKDCSLTTPDGIVHAAAVLKTASVKGEKVELDDLFGLLDIEAALTVPEAIMATQIEQHQDAAALFVKKDNAYELRLTLQKGETKINGAPFNPMSMMMGKGRD